MFAQKISKVHLLETRQNPGELRKKRGRLKSSGACDDSRSGNSSIQMIAVVVIYVV